MLLVKFHARLCCSRGLVQGMLHIQVLGEELRRTTDLVHNGRDNLSRVKRELTSNSLEIIANYRKAILYKVCCCFGGCGF